MKSDEQLISDYLEGDERALSVLVDRHLTAVYNFAFSLTRDTQAAEDITQESFIKAWKNIRRFIPTKSFQAWIFAIARNNAIDLLRKKKDVAFSSFETAEGETPLLSSLADKSLLPNELLERAEDVAYAQRLLADLDPLYRDVLALRYENGMTFAEIGKALKKPLHTVKSQHRRALVMLQRALQTETA